MSLPALPVTADTRSITERVNVLIRDYNTLLGVPAGCIMPYAGATAPDGWLLCRGQAVSRTTYADLFAVIGTAYGVGDGSTTFNLPDLGGRVPAGKEATATRLTAGMSGVDGATLGATGGDQRMPQHSHGVGDPGHLHGNFDHAHFVTAGQEIPHAGNTGRAAFGDGTNVGIFGTSGVVGGAPNTGSNVTGISIQTAGGGASQNVQPTIILNYVIAT